ncbi:hypothetical protein [Dulcicalothrix desertica]|nr:hypothetical protein [Dulcicalothrix desertica]
MTTISNRYIPKRTPKLTSSYQAISKKVTKVIKVLEKDPPRKEGACFM